MQYQLKKVNIHLPFWLEWNGWTDSKGQNIGGYSDEYKDWVRNSNEYVQLQEVGNDAFRRGFNLSLAYDWLINHNAHVIGSDGQFEIPS